MIKFGFILVVCFAISMIIAFSCESIIATIVATILFMLFIGWFHRKKSKTLNIIGDCKKGIVSDCDCCKNMVFFPVSWVNENVVAISTIEKCPYCQAITHISQETGLSAIKFKCPTCKEIDICILEPQEIIKSEIDGVEILTYVPGEACPICQYCNSIFKIIVISSNNEIQAKLIGT